MRRQQRPIATTLDDRDPEQLSGTVWCLKLIHYWSAVTSRPGGLHQWALGRLPDLMLTACFCTLLLQTTNKKWCMTCRLAPFQMTLSDLQSRSLLASFFRAIFIQLCSSWQDFNWHSVSCSPFVIAELLVYITGFQKSFGLSKPAKEDQFRVYVCMYVCAKTPPKPLNRFA